MYLLKSIKDKKIIDGENPEFLSKEEIKWLIEQAEMVKELKEELISAYQSRGEMYWGGEKEWIDNRIKELKEQIGDD